MSALAELPIVHPANPSGLKLAYDIITPKEEVELIGLIDASDLALHDYDPGNPRMSASFGWTHDFVTDQFNRCAPMPDGFRAVSALAGAFAEVSSDDLVECLLNRYDPGAIIQPHLDKPVWNHVIGISLGSAATMQFRKKVGDDYEQVDIELPQRSIYLLTGDARHLWQHSLPPVKATRWSITFRSLSEDQRSLRN